MAASNITKSPDRLKVLKTYKIFIDGKFPRTESGRYYPAKNERGETIANVCASSRKDFREAVVAARKAQPGWASRSAYNRGQILYRVAEMLEGRRNQFVEELQAMGFKSARAEKEVDQAIDTLIYFAGWTDKYTQVFSSVNPVESSHFNFSLPEATGVVAMICPQEEPLHGLVSLISAVIAGGNTTVLCASEGYPLCAVTFSEVLHSSDLPAGVVNILTGSPKELIPHFSTHMDVNAIVYCGEDAEEKKNIQINAALNVKRPVFYQASNAGYGSLSNPYTIMDFQEIKTTWHPVGV